MNILKNILYFEEIGIIDIIDIVLVALIIYNIYITIARTRALPVLKGFIIILVILLIARWARLETLSAMLWQVVQVAMIMIIVLFPAEIRRALYSIGQTHVFGTMLKTEQKEVVSNIVDACKELKKKKTGALIVIEGNDYLQTIVETGTLLNAEVDKNLITTVFNKTSPLHDGAVIIRRNKIVSVASYISNLSSDPNILAKYGTRHRAGLGLSEQSDAAVIIISEEQGTIGFAHNSRLYTDLTIKQLTNRLDQLRRTGRVKAERTRKK